MHKEIIREIACASGREQAEIDKILTRPKELKHGDLALPCFFLAKDWQISPPQCAERLAAQIRLPSGVSRTEVQGPYLNFFFDRAQFAHRVVFHILNEGDAVGTHAARAETVIVEYSSPNIAKPFHIGHLRTTLIGHALDRLYRRLGYTVVSINHLGDWGTQFGFVYAGCTLWGRPESASIFDLVELYIRASNLRRAQEEKSVLPDDADKPDVNRLARDYFLRLEAKDPEARKFWQWCLSISLEYLYKLYDRLGVRFDHYTGESFYEEKLPEVERMLRESGVLEDSRGALGVQLEKKLGFVRIFAEDGRSLYITRDIATADYRYRTFHPHKILYVVGAPQSLHFQQLKSVLSKIGHPVADAVVHVAYGNVPGISTRKAGKDDRIWLHSLLEEAHDRALDAYRSQVEKKPSGVEQGSAEEAEIAEKVGLGAILFNYLCRSNVKEFNFSWEEALNFQGDTGPYIQYALARLHSIEAKAREQGLAAAPDFDAGRLSEDESHALVSLLSRFHDSIAFSVHENEPYHVALLTLDIARAFSSAYNSLRVIGVEKPLAEARLSLFRAVRHCLHAGLSLLGVPTLERM